MFKIIAGDFEKDIKLNEILGEFILFTSDGYRVRRLNYGVEKLEILDKDQASEILRGEGLNVDFADKWAEAVGQSLYYGLKTDKQPGILLILESGKDEKYLCRVQLIADKYNIKIWTIKPDEL